MTSLPNEELIDTFLDHLRYLLVAHHVPGRIRIKATWSGARKLAEVEPQRIETVIGMIPGIIGYRVNARALSVVVEYDIAVLPFELWQDVSSLGENPGGREAVRQRLLAILQDN